MPRIAATLGVLALVTGAIGWNIARYPIVWSMTDPQAIRTGQDQADRSLAATYVEPESADNRAGARARPDSSSAPSRATSIDPPTVALKAPRQPGQAWIQPDAATGRYDRRPLFETPPAARDTNADRGDGDASTQPAADRRGAAEKPDNSDVVRRPIVPVTDHRDRVASRGLGGNTSWGADASRDANVPAGRFDAGRPPGFSDPREAFGDALLGEPSSTAAPIKNGMDNWARGESSPPTAAAGVSPPVNPSSGLSAAHGGYAARVGGDSAAFLGETVVRLPPVDNSWPGTPSRQGPDFGGLTAGYPTTGMPSVTIE